MSAVLKNSTPVQTPIVAAIPHLSAVPASAPEVVTIHSTIRYATYAEFFRSKLNVRRNNGSDVEGNSDFEELVALIGANGVLQNLIAYEDLIKDVLSGRKAVVAGGRRLAAVGVAIARGLLPDDYMIPYLVVTEDEAVQVSLAENSGRKDMHPADVADAMLELHKRGVSVADIALSFGVEEIAVRRRLKLANVSPNLFALYREDKLSLDCMQAFALTDDHEKQEMAFKALTKIYRLYPHDIRRMLTETKISFVHHPVARYVTVETFEKAGGMVERDLFANNAEGFTDDAALVEKLAHEKLKRKAEKVKQE
ncbi:MAG TPA: ParB/RepB/Spo0J family partition protein, partial [Rhizobium sp.]|nr:ParB/RepB/Spo0J family partition protein [Rhizobium sp.]